VNTLWQDVRYAIRMLRKSPGFTTIALIMLAIGIGANTIMFSMVNVLLFRPVVAKDPDRLVGCGIRYGYDSYSVYIDIRDSNPVFSDLMAYTRLFQPFTLVYGSVARRVNPIFVSANYFSTQRVAPALGRGFLPEEERQGAEPVVVLSHRTWQRQGADPDVVGTLVTINGTPFRVIGIAPERFTGTGVIGPDVWLPLGAFGLVGHQGETKPERMTADRWNYPGLLLVGRLKAGLDMAAAEAQLQSLVPRIKERYPRDWQERSTLQVHRLPRFATISREDDRARLSVISLFLMAVSAIVLLIACLNLGNMIVVQGAARRREIAIRMAIGGGRLAIIRQLFIESFLLAILGGAFGLIFAFWGTRILNAWMTGPQAVELYGRLRMSLDVRVLTATLGFCLIATVLFGLKPALRLSRRDVIAEIKESGGEAPRSVSRRRRFVSRGLSVVGQIALSVVLVMGAAMFTRSALYAAQINPAFSLSDKLLVEIDPPAAGYDRTRSLQVYETLTDRLGSMPGIQAAGVSTSFPFCGDAEWGYRIAEYTPGAEDEESDTRPKRRPKPAYVVYSVGGEFFESIGIPLLQGWPFNRLDSVPDAEKVVIIDDRLARRLRPNGSALGCLIQFGFSSLSSPYEVVGIVPDVRSNVDRQTFPQIYVPLLSDQLPAYIHLRVTGVESETALLERITAEIRRADPQLPMVSVSTLAQKYRTSPPVWGAGLGARLAITLGAMALFLASLGIYAVKGYMVASRTREIGIRKALGSTHKDIMGMVFREGAVLTVAGLVVGLLLGLGTARLIGSLFFGVGPVDVISIVLTVTVLGLASLLASYIPARRAAKIDPMVALRHE
jgi:putative ABC transport system permease protein